MTSSLLLSWLATALAVTLIIGWWFEEEAGKLRRDLNPPEFLCANVIVFIIMFLLAFYVIQPALLDEITEYFANQAQAPRPNVSLNQ